MSPLAEALVGRLRHHALAVLGLRRSPLPVSAMLRSGGAVGAGFALFIVSGRVEAAVLCAFFTNFLCLADRAALLPTRLWVQVAGAGLFVAAGALGFLLAGHTSAVLGAVLVVAIGAGLVHGSSPGVEAVPRFALSCLVVTAFVPIDPAAAFAAALLGTALGVAAVLADDAVRHGRRGLHAARLRLDAKYPGPRFGLVYGIAAAGGLGAGLAWGATRPYWVTLTVLLVMQPDRRANTVRVLQRFLGTIAGVVAAFAIVRVLPDPARAAGLRALILVLPFAWPLGFERNYGLGVAVLSAWVLLVIDAALPGGASAAPVFLARLSDTAVGCAIALAGSFAVIEAGEG